MRATQRHNDHALRCALYAPLYESCRSHDAPSLAWYSERGTARQLLKACVPSEAHILRLCSSTMAASSVQEQDLIVLGRRPQVPQQPQQQAASSAADPQQARMQAAMRTRPDGSLENVQASHAVFEKHTLVSFTPRGIHHAV